MLSTLAALREQGHHHQPT